MVGGGRPLLPEILGQLPPKSKIANFELIIAHSASAVTPSEKSSINANRKSTTHFPMSLRWSSYVDPKSPKGGLKNAKLSISIKKSHFPWRKSTTKFLVSCKAFIGLTNRAKMISGRRPLLPEILDQSDRVGAKSPIFDLFSLVATQL